MAFKFINRNGEQRHLLNPGEKGRKYAKEIKEKKDVYSKVDLKDTQLAFRSGYLKARKDSANAFKANQKKANACKKTKR